MGPRFLDLRRWRQSLLLPDLDHTHWFLETLEVYGPTLDEADPLEPASEADNRLGREDLARAGEAAKAAMLCSEHLRGNHPP